MSYDVLMDILFKAVGGLGLFLLGMKNMSEGLQVVSGSRLRKIICLVTRNRLVAALVGLVVTCMIQSSSITTVMVVGLVNSSVMTLRQAIGIILGSNIGTTVTGWILTLNIGIYGLPLLGVAAFFFVFSKKDAVRYAGLACMGVGMIFFGLELMSSGFRPLRTMPAFEAWFHAFQATSYLGVLKCALVGCLLTMLVQSSSATLGITMGLAMTGMINFETAGALVLGENLGTTITAFFASMGASTTTAKRAAYAHIAFNLVGVIWITTIALPVYFPLIGRLLGNDPNLMLLQNGEPTYPHIMAAIALTHTGFNVANTLLFLPFVGLLEKIVVWMVPERGGKEVGRLHHLDVRMLSTPAIGIVQSEEQIHFMADSVEAMLDKLRVVIETPGGEARLERKLFHREEILDNVQKEIFLYLNQLVAGQVSHEVMMRAHRQIRMADEYESLSDYVAGVLKAYLKLRKNDMLPGDEEREALLALHDEISRYVRQINEAVRADDQHTLAQATADHLRITKMIKRARKQHIKRFSDEHTSPYFSLVYTDMLTRYRRMKDHALNIAEVLAGEK